MPDTVRRLLQMHDFLHRSLQEHGPQLAPLVREGMAKKRDGILLKLLKHKSSEPQITLAQFKVMVSSLVAQGRDPELSKELGSIGLDMAERLVRQINRIRSQAEDAAKAGAALQAQAVRKQGKRSKFAGLDLSSTELRILDSMQDRVAIYDRDFRYVFTNRANADYYAENAQDFVGRPSWEQIGADAFERLSKPHVERCLAGHSFAHVTRLESNRAHIDYHVTYDPLRDASGEITMALIIARDVTHLGIPADFVWTQHHK